MQLVDMYRVPAMVRKSQVPQVQFVEKIVEVPEVRIQEAGVRLLHVEKQTAINTAINFIDI